MNYEVKTPLFQGPFDLLLFFIKRDELDINDIPIAKITDDFLAYIKQLDQLNIEVASEFIVVASTLMKIKARLLLPRVEVDDQGNEIDPRTELVQHLLEYKKYKSVLSQLEDLEKSMLFRSKRGNAYDEIKSISQSFGIDIELQDLDLYKLLKVFNNILNKKKTAKEHTQHTVIPYPYTIDSQKHHIKNLIFNSDNSKVSFADVIAENTSKVAIIFNFLAVLELLQANELSITIGNGFNNFWIGISKLRVDKEAQLSGNS